MNATPASWEARKRCSRKNLLTGEETTGRRSRRELHCKLKQYRAIATRYEKSAGNFLAIHLVAAVICLN